MDKGVAIPYIVALVIGLIVVVIMIYLIYRFSGEEKWSAEKCRARFMDWCMMCKNIGWSDSNKLRLPSDLVNNCKDIFIKYFAFTLETNCGNSDWCNEYCNTSKTKLDCCTVGVKNDKCQ